MMGKFQGAGAAVKTQLQPLKNQAAIAALFELRYFYDP
jgi:hypothetical protein